MGRRKNKGKQSKANVSASESDTNNSAPTTSITTKPTHTTSNSTTSPIDKVVHSEGTPAVVHRSIRNVSSHHGPTNSLDKEDSNPTQSKKEETQDETLSNPLPTTVDSYIDDAIQRMDTTPAPPMGFLTWAIKLYVQAWFIPLCAMAAIALTIRQPPATIPNKAWILFVLMLGDVWFYGQKVFLYLHILSSYYLKRDVVKDLHYGHHDMSLDVYTAHPLDNVWGFIRRLKGEDVEPAPVILFIYGGAWGSGDKMTYTLTARTLQDMGYIVVIPNYRTYPQGTAPDMLDDVSSAISWTFEHVADYGGDPSRIHLVGHSAGAHLAALAVINRALSEAARLTHTHTHLGTAPPLTTPWSSNGNYDESNSNKVVWSPHDLRSVVCLSIVSCISRHYEHEAKRGVEWISPMKPAMRGRDNFAQHSPLSQATFLKKYSSNDLMRQLIPPFHIVHGEEDATVPYSSSELFHRELLSAGVRSTCYILPHVGHSDLILATMDHTRPHHKDMLSLLRMVTTTAEEQGTRF